MFIVYSGILSKVVLNLPYNGGIHINWQNGSTLAAIPEVDRIRRIRVCPRCSEECGAVPATSRIGLGEICPSCRVREAMEAAGLSDQAENVLRAMEQA